MPRRLGWKAARLDARARTRAARHPDGEVRVGGRYVDPPAPEDVRAALAAPPAEDAPPAMTPAVEPVADEAPVAPAPVVEASAPDEPPAVVPAPPAKKRGKAARVSSLYPE